MFPRFRTMEARGEKTQSTHLDMLDHIFLPRELQVNPDNTRRVETDMMILKMLTKTIESFESATFPSVVQRLFSNMMQLYCVDELNPQTISEQISCLRRGDMCGIYIREQNCGLFIQMLSDNEAALSTFQASLPNEIIYGDKINGDIQVDYPTRSIKVKLSTLLKSEAFAEQIHYLNCTPKERAMSKVQKVGREFEDERNVPHPMYVSQWLLAAVSNRATKVYEECPVISKKMRDEVIKNGHKLPFRRSGFYIAMKVFLQLGLTIELGAERGKSMYKLAMLKFMCSAMPGRMHMIAKIARRIDKIENFAPSVELMENDFICFKNNIVTAARKAICTAREKLEQKFAAIQASERQNSSLKALPKLPFEEDIKHQIPTTRKYIKMREAISAPNAETICPRPRTITRHQWNDSALPDTNKLTRYYYHDDDFDESLFLADIEHWILHVLGEDYPELSVQYLRRLASSYMSKARSFYEKDGFGYSRMVLVMLKIIQVMDMIAVKKHEIFRSHSSGINPKIVERLLLPFQSHLKIAMELQIYFDERNASAQYPGLIEEEKISASSFSVRFAAGNAEMQKIRREILETAEQQIEKKRVEHLEARGKVAEMRSKSFGMSHEFYFTERGNRKHSKRCDKCTLDNRIKNYTISLYERPLRPDATSQNAVVFELLVPPEIACLRDILYLFVSKHYDSSLEKNDQHGKWTDLRELSVKRNALCNPDSVFLGSTTPSTTCTSFGRSKHPDNSFSEFVVENGYNCVFYADSSSSLPIHRNQQSVKKCVTFLVEPQSVYSGLQWALSGTSHTQNSVLAKQCDCPDKLSLSEFVNFGSIRADGHRLQLRNLYRVIETEGLSFETQSVLALVMQSLWEAGPLDATRSQWYREAHEDFADGVFAMAMIGLLERYVEQQASNWKHPFKLIVAATIAVKIFEINSDEANVDRIVQLLIQIREIAIEWIASIAETMDKCTDEKNRAVIYASLVEAAICGVFTYFVCRDHPFFDSIFADGPKHSSTYAWLHFMVTIKDNRLAQSIHNDEIKHLLIRMVQNIALNAEAKLGSLIAEHPGEVHKFVRFQWPESQTHTFLPIEQCSKAPQVIVMYAKSEERSNHVQVDLVTGEFSVNNLTATGLPGSFTASKQFSRVFCKTVFKVQPTISNQRYETVHKYNGFTYIFQAQDRYDVVTITEKRPSINNRNCDRELIPPEKLRDEIPYLLIENYSHWWYKDRHIIEFRPKTFESPVFSTPNGVEYEFDLDTRQLKHVKTQEFLLDVRSESFDRIADFFSRVEQKNYIHVLTNENAPAKAIVHLMRMNLKFIIDCAEETADGTYDVESNEYCGMRVSLDQTFGTLIGLRNGLLLEVMPTKNESNSKLFVVPHGHINFSSANRFVDLDNQPLRKPAFFIYQVDNECKQIKANNYPGWFYLAYLHAVTSYSLPDPFTGMTGSERALQILQSARVWSPSPYDEESIATLRLIAALTPIRTFIPHRKDLKVMQRIQWPASISPKAAQDTYFPIVQKLIGDSQRLSQLYSQTEKIEIKVSTYWPLNERELARNSPFNPNCIVSETFVCPKIKQTTRFEASEDDIDVAAVRQLSILFDENTFIIPSGTENSIYELLIEKKQTLVGVSSDPITKVIEFCSSNKLPDLWIRLYDCARRCGASSVLTREHFHLILSFLAFEGNEMKHLYILQAIAAKAQEFEAIPPPPVAHYSDLKKHQYDEAVVKQIIQSATPSYLTYVMEQRSSMGYSYYYSYSLSPENEAKIQPQTEFDTEITSVTQKLLQYAGEIWQTEESANTSDPDIATDKLDIAAMIRKINSQLQIWKNNRKLHEFINNVEAKLKNVHGTSVQFSPEKWPIFNVGAKQFPKYTINFKEKLSRNFESPPLGAADDIESARQIYIENSTDNQRTLAEWWQLFNNLSVPSNEKHLVDSGLYPRLIPSLILPKLLSINDKRQFMIGAIAVMTTREQSKKREDSNKPHTNWKPHERPEWLLFEIEMDLSIRRIQVEIAERMIQPPGGQHSVMQLNMGEGKTAVIVPILAAVLADGSQLCTVTVLKSLFQTNLRSLRQCLGGMLNRRVYTFPCRRDMEIEAVAGDLLPVYEECKRERGVVMTLPEYRLSFQLKIYEAARKGDTASATNFLNVHKWLNQNARHILDESDAILDAKYQLIYTVGAQSPLDAGALRWKIIQAVLKRVPLHMRELLNKYGDSAIEVNETNSTDDERALEPEMFRFQPCRLLKESIYGELLVRLIDDFLDGSFSILFPYTEITDELRQLIVNVLRDPSMSREDHNRLMQKFEDSKTAQETIFILSGLLKFEVLKLALMKRWRVNYGVNPMGKRKMAVPFRAKDVAAEMTEFGHPDVAICLTHLSYYYSGLSDAQLYETFDVLALAENPKDIYDEWIQSIPFSGVNLSDPDQRSKLFGLLRFNMHVIDYWLSTLVFPREAKVFDGKLMCSAWDLCSEHLEHIVTGFSGTNDTQLVLPMPIKQNDLKELEATNENVRDILLLKENDHYRSLRSNVSGMEILHQLVDDGIPVLLDAGALMLELNNEQTAREWLKLASIDTYDAAIFFSKDDILMTIDRNGFITEFEYSVYRERLGRCLVYLDDVHTRGTDLKFPSDIRACVTLSGRITRDKTVQACMRMRMLGQKHTVSFWASHEADIGIRELNGILDEDDDSISTSHVIEYICHNSRKIEEEGLVHWSAAGINYTQKLAAHKCFEQSVALKELNERCTDRENTPLPDMYGAKDVQALTIIIQNQIDRLASIYNEQESIHDWINKTGERIVLKLEENIPNVVRYTMLDQEHERELEHELEEQRQISRPRSATSSTPQFKPLLRELFIHGKSHDSFTALISAGDLLKLPLALKNTKLFSIMQPDSKSWENNIFVTKDFMSVATLPAHDGDDEFLRPVWWIGQVIDSSNGNVFILLSPFECNVLLPIFRSSTQSILHMFCLKASMAQSDLLNDKKLQLPTNSPHGNVPAAKAVQIAIFAGSLYFNDQQEESAYCNFMGYIPRPLINEHEEDKHENRHHRRLVEFSKNSNCQFHENPDKIAIRIIETRRGYLSTKSHVSSLLVEGKRVRWNN